MSTRSSAEGPSPDASLADAGEAYSHRGLTYPLGRGGPGEGEIVALADGVGWARLPMPGSLNHINVWLLDDGDGVAVVDTGLDIAPGAGVAYVAPADGVVVLAAQSPFTLEGNLLIVDHGMGLNSAFLHSSRLAVKEGDVVRQGQLLGYVGATGRASGPHLHWSIKWRDARLDPLLFLPPR